MPGLRILRELVLGLAMRVCLVIALSVLILTLLMIASWASYTLWLFLSALIGG